VRVDVVTSPLISVDELAGRLDDAQVVVCDVRWYLADPGQGRREYERDHIPGAVFVDLDTVLTSTEGPGRHPLPSPADFVLRLGELGISPEQAVVAYDSSGGSIAARLWWMLRQIGHHDARVLDGAYQAWIAAGHPTSPDPTRPAPRDYPAVTAEWSAAVDLATVRREMSSTTLVDARAGERYRGENEPIDARPGHIPGAINLPHAANLGADGRHLSPLRLRERYAQVADGAIVYCGSGVTACADLLAMEVAGLPPGRLYEGSWSEWAAQPELPAEPS
jgi:thiosulfate/3-mercaptopyruvate sulfurtransferase